LPFRAFRKAATQGTISRIGAGEGVERADPKPRVRPRSTRYVAHIRGR
jgi:hypothetical protein